MPEVDLLRAEVFRLGGALDAANLQIEELKKEASRLFDQYLEDGAEKRIESSQKNEHCKNGPECASYDCDCECEGCRKSMGCA